MEDETPAIEAARRTCFFAQSAFRRGNGRSSGIAARIAPSLFRSGNERILREDQSCEQRPAGRPRRSGAPAEAMAGRGRIFVPSAFRRGNGRRLDNAGRCGKDCAVAVSSGRRAQPAGRSVLRTVSGRAAAAVGRAGRADGREGAHFCAVCLSAREWPQPWQCGASRQGLRRRCFARAMSVACGKISPADSVRQGGRGGRARRQSRWPRARFCGGSASGAGMAADLATRGMAARIAPSPF